jgi:hypothetical protein
MLTQLDLGHVGERSACLGEQRPGVVKLDLDVAKCWGCVRRRCGCARLSVLAFSPWSKARKKYSTATETFVSWNI